MNQKYIKIMKKEISTTEVYKKILRLLKKHKEEIVFDVSYLEYEAKCHILGLELVEKYGLNIDPKKIRNTDWQELKYDVYIGFFDGEKRKISWPDSDEQPKNEMLILFKYPTGPYFLDRDYPTELFHKFFMELMSYKPKYSDSHNKVLYFSLDNAKDVFNNYDDIVQKYRKINETDKKEREIKRLKEEISKLEKK